MTRKVLFSAVALVLLSVGAGFGYARAQVLSPKPEDLRFQLLINEPIATPDRRSVVAGTSALVLKDSRSGHCHVVVTVGGAIAMAPVECGL